MHNSLSMSRRTRHHDPLATWEQINVGDLRPCRIQALQRSEGRVDFSARSVDCSDFANDRLILRLNGGSEPEDQRGGDAPRGFQVLLLLTGVRARPVAAFFATPAPFGADHVVPSFRMRSK